MIFVKDGISSVYNVLLYKVRQSIQGLPILLCDHVFAMEAVCFVIQANTCSTHNECWPAFVNRRLPSQMISLL